MPGIVNDGGFHALHKSKSSLAGSMYSKSSSSPAVLVLDTESDSDSDVSVVFNIRNGTPAPEEPSSVMFPPWTTRTVPTQSEDLKWSSSLLTERCVVRAKHIVKAHCDDLTAVTTQIHDDMEFAKKLMMEELQLVGIDSATHDLLEKYRDEDISARKRARPVSPVPAPPNLEDAASPDVIILSTPPHAARSGGALLKKRKTH